MLSEPVGTKLSDDALEREAKLLSLDISGCHEWHKDQHVMREKSDCVARTEEGSVEF